MIDNGEIHTNQRIPEGIYNAEVVHIEAEKVKNTDLPKLLIRLKLHYQYGIGGLFKAILYPTQFSINHYRNFYNTFMYGLEPDDYEKAIGRTGSIGISPAHYKGWEYSVIRFIPNPAPEGSEHNPVE